ncbi:hypothetical protein D3C81_1597490 [compost metagenome]
MPLRHARRAKTKGLGRRVHPALHGAVQLIELGLQRGQAFMDRTTVLAEPGQQRFDFLRGEGRIQRASPPAQPHAARDLLRITRHAAAQAHDGRVVGRFEHRVVAQDRLEHSSIQWLCLYCLLKACRVMNFKTQGDTLGVGQCVQHGGIQIVQPVQVLIARVPCFISEIRTLDQHSADGRVLRAEAV